MEALARAQQRREEALKAQAALVTKEKAAIAEANARAKEHGLVEKNGGLTEQFTLVLAEIFRRFDEDGDGAF